MMAITSSLRTRVVTTSAGTFLSNKNIKVVPTTTRATTRSIAIGTDMSSSSSMIHLQKARPWYRKITESNLAIDHAISLKQLFGSNNNNKTVGVFGIPAPFTGTCTCEHVPGYQALASELRAAGCDELVCYAVTDPYAHYGWKMSMQPNSNVGGGGGDDDITFLADPDASFAIAYGIDRRYDDYSLGLRSERFRMIVVDGVVTNFALVENAASDAQEMLRELRELQEENADEVPPAAAISS